MYGGESKRSISYPWVIERLAQESSGSSDPICKSISTHTRIGCSGFDEEDCSGNTKCEWDLKEGEAIIGAPLHCVRVFCLDIMDNESTQQLTMSSCRYWCRWVQSNQENLPSGCCWKWSQFTWFGHCMGGMSSTQNPFWRHLDDVGLHQPSFIPLLCTFTI